MVWRKLVLTFVELSCVEVNHLSVKLNICNTEETGVIVVNNSALNLSEFRILGGEDFQIRLFFFRLHKDWKSSTEQS